eukprot:scaffold8275_cov61-Phaeocystis_antarctica.AAC.8
MPPRVAGAAAAARATTRATRATRATAVAFVRAARAARRAELVAPWLVSTRAARHPAPAAAKRHRGAGKVVEAKRADAEQRSLEEQIELEASTVLLVAPIAPDKLRVCAHFLVRAHPEASQLTRASASEASEHEAQELQRRGADELGAQQLTRLAAAQKDVTDLLADAIALGAR